MTAAEAPINESMNPSGDEIAQETLDSNDTINNDTSNKSHPTHKNNPLWLLVLNSYSTVVVFVRHLFSVGFSLRFVLPNCSAKSILIVILLSVITNSSFGNHHLTLD